MTAGGERAAASRTAVGFRVKSGFAVAVVLSGPAGAPHAVARRIVALSDPDEPTTKQPYHDGFYKTEEDAAEIARRVKIVKRCATQSIAALVDELDQRLPGRSSLSSRTSEGRRAALVVGSVIDPATVGNPHIRAHAHEGRLFRTVLEEALQAQGIECDILVDKQLAAAAATRLRRSSRDITKTLTAFGETLGKPWRADEKAAATAAWMTLRDLRPR